MPRTAGFLLTALLGWIVAPVASAQTSGAAPDIATTVANAAKWQALIAGARPAADDTVYVLVHSSRDCPYCTSWKTDPSGMRVAGVISDGYPKVRIFLVDRDTLDVEETRTQYPKELAFEFERRQKAGELSPGVPQFELFLKGKPVYRGSGLSLWVDEVVPAIVSIEKRRAMPGASSATASPPTESSGPPKP